MSRAARPGPWLAILLLSACGQRDETLVAEVGTHRIEAEALVRFVTRRLPGQRTEATVDEARRHYLQAMIDGRLMLLEAESRGLEADESVLGEIGDAIDEEVIRLWRKLEIPTGAPVSEEEARARFEQEGFARERRCSAILVADSATMDTVLTALRSGRPFAEVARTYSRDARSAADGGDLGYVGRNMIESLHIPPDLFRNLPAGQLSPPVSAGKGAWHVVRFTDERPAAFAKYRPFIEAELGAERRQLAGRQHLELLRESYGVRLDPAGLAELMDAYRRRRPDELVASTTPLYVDNRGTLTVSEADRYLRAVNLRRAFADTAEAVKVLTSAVLRPYLLKRAALDAGYYDREDVVEHRERTRRNVLVDRVAALATGGIELSEEGIRSYYEAHPAMFRIERSTTVEELLLPTRSESEAIKDRLLRGESLAALLDRSRRPDALRNEGRYHFHPQDALVYPRLLAAIENAEEGEWTGPVQVEHGYSVFRVLFREPVRTQPYDEVWQRSRSLLLREREATALDKLILGLRDKYADRVTIHEQNLREALPDSLVAG